MCFDLMPRNNDSRITDIVIITACFNRKHECIRVAPGFFRVCDIGIKFFCIDTFVNVRRLSSIY